MKTQRMPGLPLALSICVCALFIFSGTAAHAYTTTDQQAFTVDNKAGVFFIEYRFGHKDHRLHMPLIAKNATEAEDTILSYSLYNEFGERVNGESAAIILGGTTVRGSEYLTPRGAAVRFTLLVIFTPEESGNYHLQVEHLPFSFDGEQKLQLNPSELQYYRTEPLQLNPS